MRVALCQYAPVHKNPAASMAKVDELLNEIPGKLDLIVLPELSFTGYTFNSYEEAIKYAEPPSRDSATFKWAKNTAIGRSSFVVCGFLELESNQIYISMLVVGRDGSIIGIYRKHNIFGKEKLFATAGAGYGHFYVKELGTVGVGICNDINPIGYPHVKQGSEFADYMIKAGVDIILFIANVPHYLPKGAKSSEVTKHIQRNWARRIEKLPAGTPLVAVSRVGTESGTTFVGSSAVLLAGNPDPLCSLNNTEEAALVCEIT